MANDPISARPAAPLATTPDFPWLAGLNAPQRAAVEATDGPVLVLAGAGTGKTRALTTRLAHLLLTRKAAPAQLLAVTFTNKAAREMKERVARLLRHEIEGWWMGTFHSLAARILRRHAELIGLKSNFTILDTDDQIRLMRQLLGARGLDEGRSPARAVLGVIERWKDRGLTPEKVAPSDADPVAGVVVAELYAEYQERLKVLNACDFGDLLLHNLTLFQTQPELLAEYQDRFRYVLVDEYQDTNVAQYLWLRLLAQKRRNICCVGDDDQSIYGWRGAEVGNILRFEKDFPGACVIRLEENYRSTGHILGAASGLIAHNQGRLGKTLWTASDDGEPVRLRAVWDGEEEARWVGDEIEALQRKGQSLGEMAVLVRAGFQTREFEERFITLGLPYRVVGGPRFYERQEIRDAIAYLRVVAQPDDDLAFERIVNTPKRGLGEATLQTLHAAARAAGASLTEATLRLIETDELKPKPRAALRSLTLDFERWRASAERMGPGDLARAVLDESGYTAMWQADKSPEAPGRLDNLKELVNAMGEFDTLTGFLEHVSLVMDNAEGDAGEQVTLMTLHAAKGLEFDVVFLPGWEEGLFPNQRALDEGGLASLEEERRLAYVGLTRARRIAYVSYAQSRRVHGNWSASPPSRFLDELPEEHVLRETEMSFGGDFSGARYGAFGGGGFGNVGYGGGRGGDFQPRGARRGPPTLEGRALDVTPRARPKSAFERGQRVFHDKFGYGEILAVDGDKLEIAFEHSGRKKVMDSFVKPAEKA